MLRNKIDKRLEPSTATACYLDILRSFDKSLHLAKFCIKLHHINLLYAILEESVDGGVKILKVCLRDTPAAVNTDNHACGEVIAASHSIETRTTVGTHTGKLALLRKYACTETCQNLAIVNTSLGACNNLFDKSTRQRAPGLDIADDFVDLCCHQLILLPVLGHVSIFFTKPSIIAFALVLRVLL